LKPDVLWVYRSNREKMSTAKVQKHNLT